MGLRLTTYLLIANIVVFVIIIRIHNQEDPMTDSDDYFMLIGSRSLDVDRLEISELKLGTQEYTSKIVLSKNRNRWFMEAPVRWPANFHAVNSIINQIKYLQKDVSFSVEDILNRGQSLADYGLELPSLILRVSFNNKELTLKVGAPTELEDKFYMLGPQGENIYVLGSPLLSSINVNPKDVRDPSIFNLQPYEIDALQIEGKKESASAKVRIERIEEDWKIQLPIIANADNDQVDRVIQRLLMSRVQTFYSKDSEVGNADFEEITEIIVEGNQVREKLSLGYVPSVQKEKNILFGKLDGLDLLFTLDQDVLRLTKDAQESLRDRSLTAFNKNAVHSIDIEQKGGVDLLSLRKKENGEWQVIHKNREDEIVSMVAEESVVSTLIRELNDIKVEEFITDAPTVEDLNKYGIDIPSYTVTVMDGTTKKLLLGDFIVVKDQIYVKFEDISAVYSVDDSVSEVLNQGSLHYRNRVIDSLSSGAEISSIQILDINRDQVVLYRKFSEESNLVKDPDETVVQEETPLRSDQLSSLNRLLEEMRSFQVESIVSDRYEEIFEGEYGNRSPWKFELTVGVLLSGGSEKPQLVEKKYFFTRRLGGSLQGGASKEKNLTFELEQSTIDALYKLVFERKLPEDYRKPNSPTE